MGTRLTVIHLARKPLEGTVASNALRHGTGGLNIDACRIPLGDDEDQERLMARTSGDRGFRPDGYVGGSGIGGVPPGWDCTKGRWPANLILSSGAVGDLDQQSGVLISGSVKPGYRRNSTTQPSQGGYHGAFGDSDLTGYGDTGGASRFFKQVADDTPSVE